MRDFLLLKMIINSEGRFSKKSITKSPPRIQRFLTLQKYEFEVAYIPGRKSVIADTLSRTYLTDNTQEISDREMDKYIHIIL